MTNRKKKEDWWKRKLDLIPSEKKKSLTQTCKLNLLGLKNFYPPTLMLIICAGCLKQKSFGCEISFAQSCEVERAKPEITLIKQNQGRGGDGLRASRISRLLAPRQEEFDILIKYFAERFPTKFTHTFLIESVINGKALINYSKVFQPKSPSAFIPRRNTGSLFIKFHYFKSNSIR